MRGDRTRLRHPIAVALAVRDALAAAAESATVLTADGRDAAPGTLVEPAGDTSLALALIAALRSEPEAVFVLQSSEREPGDGVAQPRA